MSACLEFACCALQFSLHQRGLIQKRTVIKALHSDDGIIFTIMGKDGSTWRRSNGKIDYKSMHVRLGNRAPSCITTGDILTLTDAIQSRMDCGAMREYEVSA